MHTLYTTPSRPSKRAISRPMGETSHPHANMPHKTTSCFSTSSYLSPPKQHKQHYRKSRDIVTWPSSLSLKIPKPEYQGIHEPLRKSRSRTTSISKHGQRHTPIPAPHPFKERVFVHVIIHRNGEAKRSNWKKGIEKGREGGKPRLGP